MGVAETLGKETGIGAAEKVRKARTTKGRSARYSEITRDETFIKHTAHDSFVDFQQSTPGSGRI